MTFVIIARSFERDDRYIGESSVTHLLFWSSLASRAKQFESLEAARSIVDNFLDDERNCQFSRLVAAFGLTRASVPCRITLEIASFEKKRLGEIHDSHSVWHYPQHVRPTVNAHRGLCPS